jgi:hypothetical protein
MMWHLTTPTTAFLHLDCEIEIATGQIIRGVFISCDTFRSNKNIDYSEWERWREVDNANETFEGAEI